ncbi:MBL fold metallo-hydrolase [Candidatus Bipolaricaulota bacterium]|nr:MBL fold metallo-hydrolase [Candidatus Bipolaricaulota bacterium]
MKAETPEGITLIRNGLFDNGDYGSTYLVGHDQLALVDPGTSYSVPVLLEWFEEHSLSLSNLKYILLTHIHLDHAGAAGHLVEKLPNLKVYLHRKGAPHLRDPAELLESVREATGDRFSEYGEFKPIPEENLETIGGEKTFNIGSKEIVAFPTPGHAPHHLAYYDNETGGLFPGDSAGLYLGGRLIPSTPPPTFNLEKSLDSLTRMKESNPSILLYPHFGPGENPGELIDDYKRKLRDWVEQVDKLRSRYEEEEKLVTQIIETKRDWIRNGFSVEELKMNIRGVLKYFSWREDDQK